MSELKFRAACVSDVSRLLEIYAPYVKDTAVTFEYDVPSVGEFAKRIEKILTRYPFIVALSDGKILGYAYASIFKDRAAYDWAVEVSIYVDKARHSGGIGRQLYVKLEQILAAMGVLNLNACISFADTNDEFLDDTSVKFHEKMGYELVGKFSKCGYKFNRWYDMIWMQKHIGDHVQNPVKVRKFSEVMAEFFT